MAFENDTIDPLLGRAIAGKLEIQQLLGTGAMGKVYRAHHRGLDKDVAIKVLLQMEGVPTQQALRFKAEARAASRLDHPNSVQILDFGEDEVDGLLYIAMELLDGLDLQEVLRRESFMGTTRICFIMSQVFSALSAAHQKGVIHRDMKPGNVMLVKKASEDGQIDDFVKVCDFGLAKILDLPPEASSGPLTRQGAVFGTPAYMSPEQAHGEPLDARSDIYSCGVIMFKAITGRTPFRAETPTGVLLQHITDAPPPLNTWGHTVDPRLAAIVMTAMEKDPKARFQDAREARDAVRAILAAEGIDLPAITGVAAIPAYRSAVSTAQVRVPRDRRSTVRETPSDAPIGSDWVPDGPAAGLALDRGGSAISTVYAETMDETLAPTVRPESAALQTLPPNRETGEDWASPAARPAERSSMAATLVAAIPGAIALLAVGGLIVYVVLRDQAPSAPARPTAALEAPRPPPQAEAVPGGAEPRAPSEVTTRGAEPPPVMAIDAERTAPNPAEAAPDRGRSSPKGAPRGAPTKPSASPESAKAPGAEPAPTQKPTSPERATSPGAEPAASQKPSASPDRQDLPTASPESANRPAALPDVRAGRPDLPALPAEPKRLSPNFVAGVDLADVRVESGVSTNRSREALERHLGTATACLRTALASAGVPSAGTVQVKAMVTVRGRLSKMEVSGMAGVGPCLSEAFAPARLPRPDTGEGVIRFALKYRTVEP